MLLKARWVVPVSSPPIENGIVEIERSIIKYVGADPHACPANDASVQGGHGGPPLRDVIDLGDSVLFPGLVNAHCHLEFSHLKNKIPPTESFAGWVRQMMMVGAPHRGCPDAGGQGGPPLQSSIQHLIQTGTTTVADHCNPNTPIGTQPVGVQNFEPLRRIPFWEVLGTQKERAEASYQKALERVRQEGGFVTPHSLYGVHPSVLNEIIPSCTSPYIRGGRVGIQSIHFLESADEDEWFRKGTGALAELVRERGGNPPHPRDLIYGNFPLPLGERGKYLLIHANYITPKEILLVKEMGAGIVHCPGSHQYFGHKRFPLEELQKTGIPIALGTDSLASNEELSMLREMRWVQNRAKASEILEMATLNGARLLGMDKEIGSIEVGKKADLVAVPVGAPHRGCPEEAILGASKVHFVMIDGKICITP